MIKRQVFYSFHYIPDNWRAATVRSIGAIEGNRLASDNDWETIVKYGDSAIKNWINNQMQNRSCTVVLIGSNTASRKWINYEIMESWNRRLGVVGINIHGLKNKEGELSPMGRNPFDFVTVGNSLLSSIVKRYNPAGLDSKERYNWIAQYLSHTIEEAINIRNSH